VCSRAICAGAARSRIPVAVCTPPKSSRLCQPTSAAHATNYRCVDRRVQLRPDARAAMTYSISVTLRQRFDDVVAAVRAVLTTAHPTNANRRTRGA
jgi:hypothetical protein